ncbi:MAG: YqzE family protein [Bacillales bacterium]
MKTNEYVKFITETVVKYMDQPKEERKKIRLKKRESKQEFLFRWFGMIPYCLPLKLRQRKR